MDSRQLDVLRVVQLVRQGELDLARELPVFAKLLPLDLVPQRLPIGEMIRRRGWQQDLRVEVVGLGPVVEVPVAALVEQLVGGAVGGRRDHAAPGRALHDFDHRMEQGHWLVPFKVGRRGR